MQLNCSKNVHVEHYYMHGLVGTHIAQVCVQVSAYSIKYCFPTIQVFVAAALMEYYISKVCYCSHDLGKLSTIFRVGIMNPN